MQPDQYFHLDQKYREFFLMHLFAVILMTAIYIPFYYLDIEPHLLTTFNIIIPVDALMALVFYKKLFKKHLNFVFFLSVVVETLIWSIYPRLANYSDMSSLAYVGGIIVLAFHLQHTRIRYCLLHFLIISLNNIMLEDQNLVLVAFLHIFITTVSSVQAILFRRNANQIIHQKELHKNILNLSSYFSHSLLNPINNMLGMLLSGINDQEKINNSLKQNSYRIEDFFQREFNDENHLLDHQTDLFKVPIFNNFKKATFVLILSMALFYTFYAIDILGPITRLSTIGNAIVLNFVIFAIHIYRTHSYLSMRKISFYYLIVAQALFTIKYYLNPGSPMALSLLLSSYLFTVVLAAHTKEKYIYILTATACLLSLVVNNITHFIIFMAFIVYFTKVVLGLLFKQQVILTRIRELAKEETSNTFSTRIESNLLPQFKKLQGSIDRYIYADHSVENCNEIVENAKKFTTAITEVRETL